MSQLLEQIWGNFATGYRCIVSGKMKHEFRELDYEAIELSGQRGSENKDVWFAPAIFSISERKIPNVIAVKAVWLDIDVKPGVANTYHDLVDAVGAVVGMIEHYEMPTPTLVKSGNGLHVYWVLSEHVSPEKWHLIAGALREACVEQNVLADHKVTIDIARILRVPETKNWKDPANPKSVDLLTDVNICAYEELEESLADLVWKVELKSKAEKVNTVFTTDIPQTPKSADLIADKCAQLGAFRSSRGNVPEPDWYAGLGVLALCVNGIEIAQDWSSGHPSYSKEATTAKFERAVEFAPTTCASYSNIDPAKCAGCPFNGKITTPLQLGETVTPVTVRPQVAEVIEKVLNENAPTFNALAQVEDALGIDHKAAPDIIEPNHYRIGMEGVYMMIPGDDDNPPEKKVIFTQPVWVSAVLVGVDGGAEIEISWINGNGEIKAACCKIALLSSDPKIAEWLLDQCITGYLSIKLVSQFLRAALEKVKSVLKEQTLYDRFGFNAKGFLIGRDLITPTETVPGRVSGKVEQGRVNLMNTAGSLEAWSDVSRLLDRPEWWGHRFTVLAALSTPLYELCNNQGSVLSLAGESASGKTTSGRFGCSAFGDWGAFTVAPTSTVNFFYDRWQELNNLPLLVNEADTMPRENLKDLIYCAANGESKGRARIDGKAAPTSTWSTLTIFTSNTHLESLPQSILNDATRARMFEITFTNKNVIDRDTGRAIAEVMDKNHGIAGRVLIDYIVKNKTLVRSMVEETVAALSTGIDTVHRFSLWQIASCYVVGNICTELGIIQFGYGDVITNAIAQLRQRSVDTKTPIEKVDEIINEWTNLYQSQISVHTASANELTWANDRIFGEVRGRRDLEAGGKRSVQLSLPKASFKKWALVEHGVDEYLIGQFLEAVGGSEKRVRLSQESNAIACYVIPKVEDYTVIT